MRSSSSRFPVRLDLLGGMHAGFLGPFGLLPAVELYEVFSYAIFAEAMLQNFLDVVLDVRIGRIWHGSGVVVGELEQR